MFTIPLGFRVLFACIAAIAGIFAAIFGQALWQNIVYLITRRGRRPNPRPFRLWLAFIICASATVICGTIVTVVPTLDSPPPTQVAWVYVTPVGQLETLPASSTSPSNANNEASAKCFDVGNYVNDVAWVSEDMLAASGSLVRIWRITDGTLQRTISPQIGGLKSMAISPDGKTAITAEATHYSGYVILYDTKTAHKTNEFEGSVLNDPIGKWVNSVLFSPDGKTFAAASNDGGVRIWNSQTGELVQLLKHARYGEVLSELVWSIAYSPDSQILASASSDSKIDKYKIHLWNISDGQLLLTLESSDLINSIAFSPDGTTLAAGIDAGPINLYKVADGSQLATLEGHLDSVDSVSWAPDGDQLASGGHDNTIRLWNPLSGDQILLLKGHSDFVSSVAFSRDGKTLASGSNDHRVCLWENIP